MTINMTFTSFEEIVEFARKMAAGQAVPEGEKETAIIAPVKKEASVKKENTQKAPVKEDPAEALPWEETAETAAEEKTYTLEDVRAALGALQKAGKKEQVRALLQEFGAAKLPEVDPADYPALMKKAGELNA